MSLVHFSFILEWLIYYYNQRKIAAFGQADHDGDAGSAGAGSGDSDGVYDACW